MLCLHLSDHSWSLAQCMKALSVGGSVCHLHGASVEHRREAGPCRQDGLLGSSRCCCLAVLPWVQGLPRAPISISCVCPPCSLCFLPSCLPILGPLTTRNMKAAPQFSCCGGDSGKQLALLHFWRAVCLSFASLSPLLFLSTHQPSLNLHLGCDLDSA